MMQRIKAWFTKRSTPEKPKSAPDLRRTGTFAARAQKPPTPKRGGATRAQVAPIAGKISDAGPGKNVLIRNRYVREDTGTHETLKILDDSLVDSGEETGIDPYNTGGFDRSKNWNNRFRD